jgi:DHA1 family tetracycline resistance protein-like MFS transporter
LLGVFAAIVQGGLVGIFTRKFGEYKTALLGLFFGAAGFVGYAFAPTPTLFLLSLPVACLIGLTMPSIRAILSQATPANAQGELQGAIAGIVSLTAVVIPFSMTHLFSFATTATPAFPGASLLAGGIALLIGGLVLLRSRKGQPDVRLS